MDIMWCLQVCFDAFTFGSYVGCIDYREVGVWLIVPEWSYSFSSGFLCFISLERRYVLNVTG